MNEQKPPMGIEWTRVHGRPGYTWNPITGCAHACEWQMPDGSIAECYAKSITDKFGRGNFEQVMFHKGRLTEPVKVSEPSGIFCCSMSDLFGLGVSDQNITDVLSIMRQTPQHIYMLLTKNAPRLRKFQFPANVWVGASVPPTFYKGQRLNLNQQQRMLAATLQILAEIDVPVRWMSIEPLSRDMAEEFLYHKLQWVVIGAASRGSRVFQPEPRWVSNLLAVMKATNTPTFFKGNLRRNPAAMPWREEFPGDVAQVELPLVQGRLF